jgi:hypothetical protein
LNLTDIIQLAKTCSVADPENQGGNGGLSDGAAIMVKRRFSKPIRGVQPFFFVSTEEKCKKIHEGAAVVGSPNSWIRQ